MDTFNILCLCVGMVGGLVGIYATVQAQRQNGKDRVEKSAAVDTTIKMDLEYIKEKTDENTSALKEIKGSIAQLDERTVRVEERVKEAHKRIDRIEL